MISRIEFKIKLTLRSDTIFGSGYSIPGGEDIAVCKDGYGYPFIKGSTFKGLIRESIENWLAWTGGHKEDAEALLGESGWLGKDDGRRIQVTQLTLEHKPESTDDCYETRVFTSLEDGVIKNGTLRLASCIRGGLAFTGRLSCAKQDAVLIRNAVSSIKYAGTLRSRGFGRVEITCEPAESLTPAMNGLEGACLRYRLHTELPLVITDLSRSYGNNYETRAYIPGSAIRGMVLSELAAAYPAEFNSHASALTGDFTRFSDAMPVISEKDSLPAIKGFYESKDGGKFNSVLKTGVVAEDTKRAKIGSVCALDGNTVRYSSAKTEGMMRIKRQSAGISDSKPFVTRGLSAGQDFTGYITFNDTAVSPLVSKIFARGEVWLGADRYEGFGKCSVTEFISADAPSWMNNYGYDEEMVPGDTVYMLAMSPFAMLDQYGEFCGIDKPRLAKLLGVESLEIELCATSIAEFGAFNRSWQCRAPAVPMYDRGSIFKLKCDTAPDPALLREVQRKGIGVRRAEGYGQILFLRNELFESLAGKTVVQEPESETVNKASELRRVKSKWLMVNAEKFTDSLLSKSQLGDIQTLCQGDKVKHGDYSDIKDHFHKNINERGPEMSHKFKTVEKFVMDVLEKPLSSTLRTDCSDSSQNRCDLLNDLFDHSRKIYKKEK